MQSADHGIETAHNGALAAWMRAHYDYLVAASANPEREASR